MPHSSSPYEVIIAHHHAARFSRLERCCAKASFSCGYPHLLVCGILLIISLWNWSSHR